MACAFRLSRVLVSLARQLAGRVETRFICIYIYIYILYVCIYERGGSRGRERDLAEHHHHHEETGHENCNDRFARRNIFGLCISLRESSRSGKSKTGLERDRWLSRKLRNTVLMHSMRRGDPPRKSSSPIRGAEYFRPLHKLIGVKSVRKIERGSKGVSGCREN